MTMLDGTTTQAVTGGAQGFEPPAAGGFGVPTDPTTMPVCPAAPPLALM